MSDRTESGRGVAVAAPRRGGSHDAKALGTFYDQRFYAIRHLPGADMVFPFAPASFSALIDLHVPLGDDALRKIALDLLEQGMRIAICRGHEAERMGEIIDELVDEHAFHHDGRTVYASVHEDENLEDVMEYFVLPNDQTDMAALVVLGEESAFRKTLRVFSAVTADVREKIFATIS